MGLIELILGLLIFLLIINLIFAVVPIPKGIGGTIVVVLIILLVWSLVF